MILAAYFFACICGQESDGQGTGVHKHWDYIVIGGGPAGLQLGHFLKKSNRDYVIMERNGIPGSFFATYPRHDMLISINKRHTGKTNTEFNLRHDWNSLLSDDPSLSFTRYSKDFFPHRKVMVDYLRDYQQKLGLSVRFNTEISNIRRDANAEFAMEDQHNNTYSCRYLILATGLWKPNTPDFVGSEYVEGYEEVPIDADDFEGQSVLILGRGNAAFEVADRIYGSTNLIHMMSRSRVRLSWATHYVGDLRAVNNGLLDTYQLKSLDGVLEAPIEELRVVKTEDGKLRLEFTSPDHASSSLKPDDPDFDNFALREPYDRIIRCLGWEYEPGIFNSQTKMSKGHGRKRKYPVIGHNYESVDFPGMYVAGTLSHSLDFRKSAGGFLHGFRYTVRALHRLLEWKNHQVAWPSASGLTSDLLTRIMKRINEASGIYQMFFMLGDVIILRSNRQEYTYLEEFPLHLLHQVEEQTGHPADEVIVVSLEYGANFSGAGNDIFRADRATGEPSEGHMSNFLHPVFYFYKSLPSAEDMENLFPHENLPRPDRLHHMVEDFLTNWDAPKSHILPLRRFLENIFNQDERQFFSHECFEMGMKFDHLPPFCNRFYMAGRGLDSASSLMEHIKASDMLV
uniref:FAD-dependent oxidoreductase domain-containing protein 2 n=1 Tax=Capitella teleta TaxID=283909 RepID=X1ZGH8_CAPTE